MSRKAATRKETPAAATTEAVTPSRLFGGAAAHTAMIDPGEAGERRPEPKTRLVAMPVMPPAMTARISFGFAST